MARILVIDDSPSALAVAENLLVEAGHDVAACTDAKLAVRRLRSEPFDLVLTDIYMPNTDGLEIIVEIRRTSPCVPVIAMSGVTGLRNMLAIAKSLGACRTLLKPYSRADLLNAIDTAMRACGGSA
jgi:CheY-like chemotaxis protein